MVLAKDENILGFRKYREKFKNKAVVEVRNTSDILAPQLIEKDGEIWVSSRDLAKAYSKGHNFFLVKVEMAECGKEFMEENFCDVSYKNPQGQERKEILMTLPGFLYCTAGLKGPLTERLKNSYLKAFEKASREPLELPTTSPEVKTEATTISSEQLKQQLRIQDNDVWVSSRDVAETFGKRHDSVLRSIENLIGDLGESGLHNFVASSYFNQQNKEQPEYRMNKDGFSLLVMGFTGKKALQFKLAYIEAFNKMREELLRRPAYSPPTSTLDALTQLAHGVAQFSIEINKRCSAVEEAVSTLGTEVKGLKQEFKQHQALPKPKTKKAEQTKPGAISKYQYDKFVKIAHSLDVQFGQNQGWKPYWGYLVREFKVSRFKDLPKDKFDAAYTAAKAHYHKITGEWWTA